MLITSLFLAAWICSQSAAGSQITSAQADERGWLIHKVVCAYQAGETEIKVLLPDRLTAGRKYRVLYVLPVEARNETRYGDGLAEIKRHDLHNLHELICVAPTFSHLPWYADHPTDPQIRQESYLLQVVLPYIERTYPVAADAQGRLLLGFSKSGWGAYSLLLRHPELFSRAAAWDAPLVMERMGQYGNGPIFGTQENFEKHQITRLVESRSELLRASNRLVLTGYDNFREHHQTQHARLESLKIPHTYVDGPQQKHAWSGGWLPEAVRLLAAKRAGN